MTIHTKPTAPKQVGDRPDDVLSEACDILRTVRLALMSEWFDPEECRSLAAVTSTAIGKLDRVYAVLSAGVQSTWDPATPKGKMVIPEFAPDKVI